MRAEFKDVLTKEQKERFDVLERGETRREKLWLDCISQAKVLVKKHEDIKMDIAELAMKACADAEIKGAKFKYTLSRFATEIGVEDSTLRGWVNARRVLIRLPLEKRTYALSFYREAAKVVLSTDKDNVVERKFNRVVRQKQSRNAKFVAYSSNLKKILTNTKNMDSMKDCDSDTIEEIAHLCTEIIHYLDLFKRTRNKAG